ncbi:MAG TPA: 5-dehydro-4-deoxy-D-glucuronate isomerase [Phycisphaerae bacterium]|nr:5-dehydro-4-deoxy-D-glucuronate isomerase [Phycisphaerae bacterium]
MKIYQMPDAVRTQSLNTAELREAFLVQSLFNPGAISLVYSDADRAVIGFAVPKEEPLHLGTYDELRSEYFAERRELGVLNIGSPGKVKVDGKDFVIDSMDCLYVGKGAREVIFSSRDAQKPAEFYLLSYPAHAIFPTAVARKNQATASPIGLDMTANKRVIYKYIHQYGIKSCQLVMGFTQLEPGSVWNTMPPHTHLRRTEVYMYFNMDSTSRVFHFMGEPTESRHLLVANREVVISPSWSIHAGAGTQAYCFCWGMGGENQTFDDMDRLAIGDLK